VAPLLGLIRPTDGAAKPSSILDKRFNALDRVQEMESNRLRAQFAHRFSFPQRHFNENQRTLYDSYYKPDNYNQGNHLRLNRADNNQNYHGPNTNYKNTNKNSNKTRKNAIVEYLDYQIPVNQLNQGPKGNGDMQAS